MIKKIVLSLIVSSLFALEYEPKKVSKDNLESLLKIDKKLYDLATKKETYKFEQVANFVYKNLRYDLDYSRFKLLGTAILKTSDYSVDSSESSTDISRDRASAQLTLTYPIFDRKELNERKKKILDVKQKIISDTKSYFEIKADYEDLKIELEMLLEIENRAKARKLQAVGSFDEWLKVIKEIRKTNLEITQKELDFTEAKQLLLSYVLNEKRIILKGML